MCLVTEALSKIMLLKEAEVVVSIQNYSYVY